MQADALQFARAHQCLAIVSSQAVSACVGRAAVGPRVRAPEVKCALVACVSSCVVLGDVACVVRAAPHSSVLARCLLALRCACIAVPLCVASIAHLEVFFGALSCSE